MLYGNALNPNTQLHFMICRKNLFNFLVLDAAFVKRLLPWKFVHSKNISNIFFAALKWQWQLTALGSKFLPLILWIKTYWISITTRSPTVLQHYSIVIVRYMCVAANKNRHLCKFFQWIEFSLRKKIIEYKWCMNCMNTNFKESLHSFSIWRNKCDSFAVATIIILNGNLDNKTMFSNAI